MPKSAPRYADSNQFENLTAWCSLKLATTSSSTASSSHQHNTTSIPLPFGLSRNELYIFVITVL
jgi:hypothetical protein